MLPIVTQHLHMVAWQTLHDVIPQLFRTQHLTLTS
jgi:hypothetical protein